MARPASTTMTLPHPHGRIQVLLLALVLAGSAAAVAAPVRAAGGDGLRQEANEYRASEGLQPVVGTALLDDIADRRAAQMANAKELEHDMDYVRDRLNTSGVCWSGFGEIIAWERGYPDYSYERTMGLWWNSPGHHAVMMGEAYNAAGGAWDTASDGGHYSVMVFVTLCDPSAAGSVVRLLRPDDRYSPTRTLVFPSGRVTGVKLSATGDILARKTVRFTSRTRAESGGRATANGKAWLKVSSGPLTGYWVHESPDSFVRGFTDRNRFDPDRKLELQAGRYYGLQFDWLGRVTAVRKYTFGNTRHPSTSSVAIINGRRYYLLSSTPLAGFWVRDTAMVAPH